MNNGQIRYGLQDDRQSSDALLKEFFFYIDLKIFGTLLIILTVILVLIFLCKIRLMNQFVNNAVSIMLAEWKCYDSNQIVIQK